MVEVKICGLTRVEDVRVAAAQGARYVGVVMAGGPRAVTEDQARAVLEAAPEGVKRVAVLSAASPSAVARTALKVGADIIQLHGDLTPEAVLEIKRELNAGVWAVARIGAPDRAPDVEGLLGCADGVVLDAWSPNSLGGSGRRFDWATLVGVGAVRDSLLILAGGLTPENVPDAVAALHPDVVDVSSGVEASPGIKDPRRIADFVAAARRAAVA